MIPLVVADYIRKILTGFLSWFNSLGIVGVATLLAFFMVVFLGAMNVKLKQDLLKCQTAVAEAAAEEVRRAWQPAIESVERYYVTRNEDLPVVERVVERVRNVCVRDTGGVSVPAPSAQFGPTGGETEDDRERARYLADLAEDIAVCQSELTRLDAIRDYHNALVAH